MKHFYDLYNDIVLALFLLENFFSRGMMEQHEVIYEIEIVFKMIS